MVKRHIPNGNMVQNVGSDVVFCLPEFDNEGLRQRNKFSCLFDEIDLNMERLGLDSYGVSDTTLEEVLFYLTIVLRRLKFDFDLVPRFSLKWQVILQKKNYPLPNKKQNKVIKVQLMCSSY